MSFRGNECRIYVGNLPPDIRSKDIEDLFYKFGKITFIDLKNRRGPPFAFVEFDDPRDAEDAVQARDGYDYDGYRLRVEFPRGSAPGRGSMGPGRGRGPPARRSQYRVLVSGLPPSGSWQDLKDHMREAGDVCYADVFKDGTGVVEFLRYEDMKYAVKKLDDSRFRSHEDTKVGSWTCSWIVSSPSGPRRAPASFTDRPGSSFDPRCPSGALEILCFPIYYNLMVLS
ncbi:hypothetical protein HPB49_017646 [Dermacentor silvarum]|uniref:Uncharacterized protein n=1 Tax=Dermacentor silvarum TaxID=543639 RepID=A0ACB8D756_DERSI|nr:hypothetical protein HPB49_017646 [Dermacentor silvarum]